MAPLSPLKSSEKSQQRLLISHKPTTDDHASLRCELATIRHRKCTSGIKFALATKLVSDQSTMHFPARRAHLNYSTWYSLLIHAMKWTESWSKCLYLEESTRPASLTAWIRRRM